MSFTADELDGVSANALASFKKRTENGEDVYDVSLQEANQIQKVVNTLFSICFLTNAKTHIFLRP